MEDDYSKKQLQRILQQQRSQIYSSEEEIEDECSQLRLFEANQLRPARQRSHPSTSSEQEDAKVLFSKKPLQKKEESVNQIKDRIVWREEDVRMQEILGGSDESLKDKKLRELWHRMKSQNIQLERQKTQKKKLQDQLNQQLRLNKTLSQNREPQSQSNIEEINYKAKFQEADKKVQQLRVKAQNAKSELNKALRVIAREVGEEVDIDKILGQQNSWKGRQQKIDKLKTKVKQLQSKLQTNGIAYSHVSGTSQSSRTELSFGLPPPPPSAVSSSSVQAQNRRKQLENLKIQLQAMRIELQTSKSKCKGLSSRVKVLQNQSKEQRNQFQKQKKVLLEKSSNDDQYIRLLKTENQKLKKEQRVITKLIYKNEPEPKPLAVQPPPLPQPLQLQEKIKKLERTLHEKQKESRLLKERVRLLQKIKLPKDKEEAGQKLLQELEQQKLGSRDQQEQFYKQWKDRHK